MTDPTRQIMRRILTEQVEPPATKGRPRTVKLKALYAWKPKVVETLAELEKGEASYHAAESPLLVSKLSRRGAWFVLDGHHRVIEAIQQGDIAIDVVQSADVPNIEHGGGYWSVVAAMVNLVDFVAEQTP